MRKRKTFLIFTLISILILNSYQCAFALSSKDDATLELYHIHGQSLANNKQILNLAKMDKEAPQVTYDYSIDYNEKEESTTVNVTGLLESEGNTSKFMANGEVEVLGNLVEGCLYGDIEIQSQKYKLLVGFSKKNDDVCLSMNIHDKNNSTVMIFGQPVINEMDDIKLSAEQKFTNNALTNSYTRGVVREFDYVTYAKAYMESSKLDDEYGVKIRLYQEENNGELLLLQLRSYAEDIEDKLSDLDPFSRGVELYEVKAGVEFTKGKCDGCHPPEDDDGSNVDVYNVLYDALNAFGIPTNILASAINGSRGYINVYASNVVPNLKVRAGSNLDLDFDDNYVPFFVIGVDGKSGEAKGEFYGIMEYKEKYRIPGDGYVYTYYESDKAEKSFSIDVDE